MLHTLSMSAPFIQKDHQIAATLSSYWANFAATGDPNGKALPAWSPVTSQTATTMEVGEHFRAIPIAGSPARIEFLKRFAARPIAATPGRSGGSGPGSPLPPATSSRTARP